MRVVETEWGGQPAVLAVLRDITERKRLELERAALLEEQLARAQAEQALRERDEFMALASHELKTPLSTLSATSQLLKRQLARQGQLQVDQLQRALDLVNEQSRRLARLIEHLLDVSSINSGKMVLAFQRVDLRQLIEEVVESCQLTTSRHTIALDGPPALEATVDPIRIEQVVTNLLDNAIKYSPDGGAIAVDLWSPEPERAAFSVRDHGLGIPADRRERLFERFYRAHPDGTVSGLGLGLFISQHIVDLHDGRITIESPDDGGARFTVELPIVRAHDLH
jgi:signal transduction histidine kinase